MAGRYDQTFGVARLLAIKPRIFVSYHHGGDRAWYDEFARVFSDEWDVATDRSVERAVDSSDTEYVMRRIREEWITGTSCTIVLCGAGTPGRKFVDWEIKATLDKEHGLVGVQLPTCARSPGLLSDQVIVPARLADNVQSGFAEWVAWDDLMASALLSGPQRLEAAIGAARAKSESSTHLIENGRPMMSRNA